MNDAQKPPGGDVEAETVADDLDRTRRGPLAAASAHVPVAPSEPAEEIPERIARYRIEGRLGAGAFGVVYRARDEGLDRPVAIKVPHAHIDAAMAQSYLREARAVAALDHPNIVPVYDVGSTDEYSCYLVYKLIPGQDLNRLMEAGPLPHHRSARIAAAVASALHHAHRNGLVHRDVKPWNILIDRDGQPVVVDFGLALRDEEYTSGAVVSGTLSYMSPEQATGGSNRVDGRSDIFSLGAVFYHMLTGRPPFRGNTPDDVLARVAAADVRPPRQWDDRIPKELERICLKALAKKPAERYSAAVDMHDELVAAATYTPRPIDVSAIEIPGELGALVEELSRNTHEVWARHRIEEGWEVGDVRDDALKTHPDLVPYDQLSEGEKEVDRATVVNVIKAMLALGYRIGRGEGTD